MKIPFYSEQPNLIAIAGPNGAGKSTFYRAYLGHETLPFVNADVFAIQFEIGAYEAAELAEATRRDLFSRRESFIFETVFSDPVGGKLSFLLEASEQGYHVVLCFVGISDASVSQRRVTQRVIEGGHDVPTDKLITRYPRTMENLRLALLRLPLVLVYDNDDLRQPHRFCLAAGMGKVLETVEPVPEWLKPLLPPQKQFAMTDA
jgi:predicted ABC-type ATPase